MSKIVIQPHDLLIVYNILHKTLPADAKIWVFGSRAKGTTKKFADLDLAIDASRQLTPQEMNQLNDDFVESDLPYKVDIVDWCDISKNFKEIIQPDLVELPKL